MVDSGKDNYEPHFIYCSNSIASNFRYTSNLKNMILSKMSQYGIQSSFFTNLWTIRYDLMTKEREEKLTEEQLKNEDPYWQELNYTKSLNDDLESFFTKLVNQEEFEEEVLSFKISLLNTEDSKLVYEKNKGFIRKFFYSTYDSFFKEKSDSKHVYAHDRCHRETMRLGHLKNKLPQSRQRKGFFKKIQSCFQSCCNRK